MNSLISILVPIYGVEKFIERCVDSLFKQTYKNIEYIFVDDCSPDKSISILKNTLEKYPHRKNQVKVITHENNQGIASARNTLLENASGEYVLFIDSDDYITLDAVEKLVNEANKEDSDVVVFDTMIEWRNNLMERHNHIIGNDKISFLKLLLSTNTMLGLPNKFLRREIFKINNIKAVEGINFGEDYMMISKFAYFAKKITKINEPLYYYVQTNPNSYTTQKLSEKNVNSLIFVLNNLSEFFESKADYKLYEESLIQGKLRKKMDIIFSADKNKVRKLNSLFPETKNLSKTDFLLFRDKIGSKLLNNNHINIFLLYRSLYTLLFKLKRFFAKKD